MIAGRCDGGQERQNGSRQFRGVTSRSELLLVQTRGAERTGRAERRGRAAGGDGAQCLHVPAGELSSEQQTRQWALSYPRLSGQRKQSH